MNDIKAAVFPNTFTIWLTKFWFWGIIRENEWTNQFGISEFEKENKIEKSYKIDGLSCKGDC